MHDTLGAVTWLVSLIYNACRWHAYSESSETAWGPRLGAMTCIVVQARGRRVALRGRAHLLDGACAGIPEVHRPGERHSNLRRKIGWP